MFPFWGLVSNMAGEDVLDPKDRKLIGFSVSGTFDANVKILQTIVPRPKAQSGATTISCTGSGVVAPGKVKTGFHC